MGHRKSDGEVYGSKAMTFAIIALSALVVAGVVYSPAPAHSPANTAQGQMIVDTAAHGAASGVSG